MFFAGNSTADIGSLKNIGSIKDQSQKLLELIVVILMCIRITTGPNLSVWEFLGVGSSLHALAPGLNTKEEVN